MKRAFFMLTALLVAFSAMAFDFTGKTFRAVRSENGITATGTIKFRANNRATMTFSATGMRSRTDSNMIWEDVGDWINLIDSTGDLSVLSIEEDSEGVFLVLSDQNGFPMFEFRQVKSTPKAGGAKKKSGKRR